MKSLILLEYACSKEATNIRCGHTRLFAHKAPLGEIAWVR